jgi:hypothetical protein
MGQSVSPVPYMWLVKQRKLSKKASSVDAVHPNRRHGKDVKADIYFLTGSDHRQGGMR